MFCLREKESLKTSLLSLSNQENTPFNFLQNERNNCCSKELNTSIENKSQIGSTTSKEITKSLVNCGVGAISTAIINKCYCNNSNYFYCSAIVEKLITFNNFFY